jgi:predicted GTPase
VQKIHISDQNGSGGIMLYDLPGVGENPERHAEYTELYKELAPELDIILWTIKADDRSYASGIEVYKSLLNQPGMPPVLFVVTQADKMNPIREWDDEGNCPGVQQKNNLLDKERDVARQFNVRASNVITVSSEYGFNLPELVEAIVNSVPNEKKYGLAREAKAENLSVESREAAEKGVWDTIKKKVGDVWDVVKDQAVDLLIASAPKLFELAAEYVQKKWFKK